MVEVETSAIQGVYLFSPKMHIDDRGAFTELYSKRYYQDHLGDVEFVQDNCVYSVQNVLRGMHFQRSPGQGKLVSVLVGEIYDVVVDMRQESPTYMQWQAFSITGAQEQQLYVPPGCAHGYAVLSQEACVMYKVTSYYDAKEEMGFAYNDLDIGIDWPIKEPILSKRDQDAMSFKEAVCALSS